MAQARYAPNRELLVNGAGAQVDTVDRLDERRELPEAVPTVPLVNRTRYRDVGTAQKRRPPRPARIKRTRRTVVHDGEDVSASIEVDHAGGRTADLKHGRTGAAWACECSVSICPRVRKGPASCIHVDCRKQGVGRHTDFRHTHIESSTAGIVAGCGRVGRFIGIHARIGRHLNGRSDGRPCVDVKGVDPTGVLGRDRYNIAIVEQDRADGVATFRIDSRPGARGRRAAIRQRLAPRITSRHAITAGARVVIDPGDDAIIRHDHVAVAIHHGTEVFAESSKRHLDSYISTRGLEPPAQE